VSATALLPSGATVRFDEVVAALARGQNLAGQAPATRARTATVVAVGPDDRLIEATDSLQQRFINNAVAALRISSLPTFVWWRGGQPDTLDGLADLADRVVLDEIEPAAIWKHALGLFGRSAFSDLRWTRITQWRALMAHFFDLADVRTAAPGFTYLRMTAGDRRAAGLFAAWLTSSVQFKQTLQVEIRERAPAIPIEEIRLGGGGQELALCLAGHRACVETAVSVQGHSSASRIVSLEDQSLGALLAEELRIRSRDLAFERAVQALNR
jgi:glucose-6-phosphate dehydrogenase assembly protein OpcA